MSSSFYVSSSRDKAHSSNFIFYYWITNFLFILLLLFGSVPSFPLSVQCTNVFCFFVILSISRTWLSKRAGDMADGEVCMRWPLMPVHGMIDGKFEPHWLMSVHLSGFSRLAETVEFCSQFHRHTACFGRENAVFFISSLDRWWWTWTDKCAMHELNTFLCTISRHFGYLYACTARFLGFSTDTLLHNCMFSFFILDNYVYMRTWVNRWFSGHMLR